MSQKKCPRDSSVNPISVCQKSIEGAEAIDLDDHASIQVRTAATLPNARVGHERQDPDADQVFDMDIVS